MQFRWNPDIEYTVEYTTTIHFRNMIPQLAKPESMPRFVILRDYKIWTGSLTPVTSYRLIEHFLVARILRLVARWLYHTRHVHTMRPSNARHVHTMRTASASAVLDRNHADPMPFSWRRPR